jgi:ADP-heptose:LPS heptosyltransferase
LVNSTLRCLLRRCPYIDEFIVYDCEYKHKGLPGFIYILKLLIIERFDVVFDFSNSFKTHLLSYLSLANKRYGYSNNIVSRFLINKGVKKTAKSSNLEIDKLAILSPLGIDSGDRKLELWPSEEDIEFADNFLRDNWVGKEKVVGMDISAKRRFFPDPSTSDYLAYLCDKLANQQIRVILFGSKEDSDLRDDLAKKIKSKPILALGDISRMQSACIIKKCNLYISLHQESLYLALAMRIPSIVILGANKNFDFSQYKNIVVLAAKDLGINMDSGNKRKRPTHKDCVIEAVNRLIQVK